MNDEGWRNLSDMFRKLSCLTTGVFQYIGPRVVDLIEPEFEKMVIETPQWTGTTAASWNISLGGDDTVRTMGKRKLENALHKGHMAAVRTSLTYNTPNFAKMRASITTRGAGGTGHGLAAIVIENNAPGYDTAEHGPLRPINNPGHMLAKFMSRVGDKMKGEVMLLPEDYFTRFRNPKC